jgi:hypothetical protein
MFTISPASNNNVSVRHFWGEQREGNGKEKDHLSGWMFHAD